jgi:hypothetical protein
MKRTMHTRRPVFLALALCLLPAAAFAQHGPAPAQPVDAAMRDAVIAGLATQLEKNYVFPEVAASLTQALAKKAAAGGYASASDSDSFARALSQDLREFGKDGHFKVEFAPGLEAPPTGAPPLPSAEDLAQGRLEAARRGYGIERVERLPGNVGYLELRGFGPTELVGEAYTAAMALLAGSDAVIIDLRRNGGGEPSSVAHLLSHFFPVGDVRHLNDIYTRPTDLTQQYWTNPSVSVRYTGPVYVLTSARTFSGGEEAAYDFQTQKRATLVGETTGGGANPGDMVPLAAGFAAFIPTGRAINPVTGTNWEHVGVKPDLAVPAADALRVAHAAILRERIAATTDAEERAELQTLLKQVESGTVPAPVYTLRR